MVNGKAILETMRAARIFRDVAADRADRLRGRIGGVKIAVRRDTLRDMQVDHSRLDDHSLIRDIYRQDAIEPGEADYDAAWNRERAAAQTRAGAARNKRNTFPMTNTDDVLHLFAGPWQHYRRGHDPKICQAVALVRPQLLGCADQAVMADDGRKFVQNLALHALPRLLLPLTCTGRLPARNPIGDATSSGLSQPGLAVTDRFRRSKCSIWSAWTACQTARSARLELLLCSGRALSAIK